MRRQYENQKPLPTLVGPVVQPGNAFSVSPARFSLLEGQSAAISAEAGGARKVYWILQNDGQETIVAVVPMISNPAALTFCNVPLADTNPPR